MSVLGKSGLIFTARACFRSYVAHPAQTHTPERKKTRTLMNLLVGGGIAQLGVSYLEIQDKKAKKN